MFNFFKKPIVLEDLPKLSAFAGIPPLTALILVIVFVGRVDAGSLYDGAKTCRSIKSSQKRLKCFDALIRPSKTTRVPIKREYLGIPLGSSKAIVQKAIHLVETRLCTTIVLCIIYEMFRSRLT